MYRLAGLSAIIGLTVSMICFRSVRLTAMVFWVAILAAGMGLAIVRELWRWRDSESQKRNRPPKRLLRDDLIVELAKRKTADPKRIRAFELFF